MIKTFIPLLLITMALIFTFGVSDVSATQVGSDNGTVMSDNLTMSDVKTTSNSCNSKSNISNSLGSKKNQTLFDPQIWRDGVPVPRGTHSAGYQYSTIGNAIDDALDGDTIMLENGATFSGDGNTQVTLFKNLTFDVLGNGIATIDGGGTRWGFVIIHGYTVTFKHIIFQNFISDGAIYNMGTMTVNACNFTNNTAKNHGGAIRNYMGTMTVNGCNFTNNTAKNHGGAISNCGGDLTVTGSLFTNNTAEYGGALENDDGGEATIKFNCIIGNTPSNSEIYRGAGTMDATLNWWGSNAGPAGKIPYYILSDPWIILNVTANPTTITNGGISIVAADLLHDSNGIYHDPALGHVPDGILITFTNPLWGTITDIIPTSSATLDGKVEAAYHTGSLPIQTPVRVYASADSEQNAYTDINILTPTTLTVNSPQGYNGHTVSIVATLTDTDTGAAVIGKPVTITVNGQTHTGTTDANGQVTWSYLINNMDAKDYTITATFAGDTQCEASNGAGTLTVRKIPTDLSLYIPLSHHYNGDTVNITATLKRYDTNTGVPVADKPVTITLNGQTYSGNTDANGQLTWTYTINNMDAKDYTIQASFAGDNQYKGSDDGDLLTVDKTPTNATVTPVHNFAGQNVTLTANVTDYYGHSVNEGSVRFTVNGSYLGTVPVNNGEATLNWTIPGDWTTGNYIILAEYLGTGNFTASNSAGNLTVDATPTSITVGNVTGINTKTVSLNATLTDAYGHPLTGKTINFKINGNNVGNGTTDSNGIAVLNYKLNSAGNFIVTAEFAGDSGYVNSTINGTLAVDPSSDLYIIITSNKNNQKVDETFTLTYKLGNNGPDAAQNVTITIPLPEDFEVSQITGDGKWTYNNATRTITWTLENVPVGDPYLYITGKVLRPGSYVFGSSISSETYNIDSQGVTEVTINAVSQVHAANKISNKIKAIPLHHTGMPLAGIILAVLAVCGGLITSKKF